MNNWILGISSSLLSTSMALAETVVAVGDGTIEGSKLEPYKLTWQQCALQDGNWQSQGSLTEELVIIGDYVIRHRQTSQQPNGVVSQADVFLDRSSLGPVRMEMQASREGTTLVNAVRVLNEDGYIGLAVQGDKQKELQGAVTSRMFHGGALGLPLATLPRQSEAIRLNASMIGFDGTYDVIAEWIGEESILHEGAKVDALLVDVEWHHHESGDVYPPGPNASGGRYWIVPEPPNGFPYVPRYQTDTYAVEFISGVCPSSAVPETENRD